MAEVTSQARERHVQGSLRLPGKQFQRGARENFEGDHGRGRISRQTKEIFSAGAAENEGLSGLN